MLPSRIASESLADAKDSQKEQAAVGYLVQWIFNLPIIRVVTKPIMRLVIKLVAIPIFRVILKYLMRVEVISEELEKDLSQWFRASVLLMIATHNMEEILFQTAKINYRLETLVDAVLFGLRLMLAIGCIEGMPDQELFRLIHSGPPKVKSKGPRAMVKEVQQNWRAWLWGVFCIHLSRTSPMFAIVCVFNKGPAGWICYGIAISQYLVIGLVTSRDRALDVLASFDAEVAARRDELLSNIAGSPRHSTLSDPPTGV